PWAEPTGLRAVLRPRVGERLPRDRHELPVVRRRVQCQLQHAERRRAASLAARVELRPKEVQAATAGAGGDLADAPLYGEALVVVVVAGCRVRRRLPPPPCRVVRPAAAATGSCPTACPGGVWGVVTAP